jgi:IPT/TIG domain
VQILDFSPEWDYTTGGSKIMFCIKPGIESTDDHDFESKFECSFGESVVPIKFIQPGVFKCKAPPHKAGFVTVNLLFNGEPLNQDQETDQFEYREQVPKKKKKLKRDAVKDNTRSLFQGDTGPSKVRVIERLTYISPTSVFNGLVDKEFIASVTESLSAYLERNKIENLETYDEGGLLLIHDLAVLDCFEAIKVLAEHGGDLNKPVEDSSITPLVIATARGNSNTVQTLVTLGAHILKNEASAFQLHKDVLDREYNLRKSSYDSEFDCKSLGSSAVDLALFKNHNDIVECLVREITLRSACSSERALDEDSPHNIGLLPQKCGISEKESKC